MAPFLRSDAVELALEGSAEDSLLLDDWCEDRTF